MLVCLCARISLLTECVFAMCRTSPRARRTLWCPLTTTPSSPLTTTATSTCSRPFYLFRFGFFWFFWGFLCVNLRAHMQAHAHKHTYAYTCTLTTTLSSPSTTTQSTRQLGYLQAATCAHHARTLAITRAYALKTPRPPTRPYLLLSLLIHSSYSLR